MYNDVVERLQRIGREDEHTLLCLRLPSGEQRHHAEMYRILKHMASRLWGPVTVSRLNGTDYAMLLERWSVGRTRQLAELLESAVHRGFARTGRELDLQVSIVPVDPATRPEELLTTAACACGGYPGTPARAGRRHP